MIFSNIIDAYLASIIIKPINNREFESLISDIASFRKLKKYKKEIREYLLENFYISQQDIFLPKKLRANNYEIAQAYARYYYFSHQSALHIHGLDNSAHHILYLSEENILASSPSGNLKQSTIDQAFSKPQRMTTKFKKFGGLTINFLKGQSPDHMNTIKDNLRVSDIEKTLIDITVRPSYSGGSKNILKSFKNALTLMDPEKLIHYYKKLSFAYPYYQSLGFYLENSGYDKASFSELLKFNRTFKFYLDYEISDPKYCEKWKIYHDSSILQ